MHYVFSYQNHLFSIKMFSLQLGDLRPKPHQVLGWRKEAGILSWWCGSGRDLRSPLGISQPCAPRGSAPLPGTGQDAQDAEVLMPLMLAFISGCLVQLLLWPCSQQGVSHVFSWLVDGKFRFFHRSGTALVMVLCWCGKEMST